MKDGHGWHVAWAFGKVSILRGISDSRPKEDRMMFTSVHLGTSSFDWGKLPLQSSCLTSSCPQKSYECRQYAKTL
jgi:hypothetical protein